MPCVMAGLIVYFATVTSYAKIVVADLLSGAKRNPRCTFILCAVCHVRVMTLTDAAHGLRVRRHHRHRALVVQDVFAAMVSRRMRDSANAHVSANAGIQVMTHHEHVEMFVDGVHRVGPRRIRSTRAARSTRLRPLMMSGA
jgi:hypothetical protein